MAIDAAFLLEYFERSAQRAAPNAQLGRESSLRRDASVDGEVAFLDECTHFAKSLIASVHGPAASVVICVTIP
jgi:hypothetical protein